MQVTISVSLSGVADMPEMAGIYVGGMAGMHGELSVSGACI